MAQFLRGIVLIATVITNCGFAVAADISSANYVLPGCRFYLQTQSGGTASEALDAGKCAGLIEGIIFATKELCLPVGVTSEQAVRVVVKYLDDKPKLLNADFKLLALGALLATWPCKK
jgi:hypothetical protein